MKEESNMKLERDLYGFKRIARYCGVTENTVKLWFTKGKLQKYLKKYNYKTLDGKIIEYNDYCLSKDEFEEFLKDNPKYKKRVEETYEKMVNETIEKSRNRLTKRLERLELEKEEILKELKRLDSGEIDLYF